MHELASALVLRSTGRVLALCITSLSPALFGIFLCLIFSDDGDLVLIHNWLYKCNATA